MLSDTADFTYQCSDLFHADDDRGIAWNDSDIGIEWPTDAPILSDKDQDLPTLAEAKDAGLLPVFDPS